jgi:hypothetical protein
MNVEAFRRACDRFGPTTASGFYEMAKRWLGQPTATLRRSDVIELTWLDDGEVVAWVVLRLDPATGAWYPALGGR